MQLIHFQIQIHSWNFQKMNHSAVCWHFQKIFASQCYKLCILVNKIKMSIRVSSVWKTWPTSFHIRSHSSKLSKIDSLSCLLTFSDDFLHHRWQILHVFRQKQNVCKVSPQSEQTQGTSFHLKVTHSKFFYLSGKIDSFIACWHFQMVLHHRVLIHTLCHTKIKKCAKVSK
jgi:hypothetical protein